MAKTFYTSGTGSQQTLTGSQDEKVAVYQTLADAEADLANLEAGQIVATPDTGDENAQPVDAVTDGDMHAVTSNAVAQELNSPFTKNIIINANANSILHIGSFTPAQANIIGASLEIQVKMYDSCYRTLATISYGNIRIGLLEGNETYCQLSLYKTSNTRYDLYLKTSSSQNCNVFIQITNPLNFTYDGSIVNDYSGTFVAPTYNNSINSVTANNMQSVTSNAVAEKLIDYQSKEWKNLEGYNISGIEYDEVAVSVWFEYADTEVVYSKQFSKGMLGGTQVLVIGGYYISANDYGLCNLNFTNGLFGLRNVYYAGQNFKSASGMKIRYR